MTSSRDTTTDPRAFPPRSSSARRRCRGSRARRGRSGAVGGGGAPAVACGGGGGGGGGGGDGAALADVVLRAPRRMSDGSPHNTARPVYFVHVGKTGGTSVDDLMTRILKCESRAYVGNAHYDWSFVRHRERLRRRTHAIGDADDDEYRETFHPHDGGDDGVASGADVITFLRHPVSRAYSQFEYSKSLPWARESNASFLHQTFDEYLDDPSKTWTQPIADGESGSDFLAGIFPPEDDGGWVLTDGKKTLAKARLRANRTAAALLAARNLEKTAWFGLLEDVGRSMEMLGATLGLGYVPVFPMTNSAHHHHHHHHHNGQHLRQSSVDIEEREARIGEGGGDGGGAPYGVDTIEKIARYVPKDLWLYEYATRLFEARYSYLVGGGGARTFRRRCHPCRTFGRFAGMDEKIWRSVVSHQMISFMRRGISVSTWGADMSTPSTRVR